MRRRETWPYPENTEEILQAVFVTVAVVFIGLVGTAAVYKSSKNETFGHDRLEKAAMNLESTATAAHYAMERNLAGQVNGSFRGAFATKLSEQVKGTIDPIEQHASEPQFHGQAVALLERGRQLQATLETVEGSSDNARIGRAEATLAELKAALTRIRESL